MELGLKGKSAIVTGNTHGIGLAISEALRAEGVYVPEISRSTGYDLMTVDGLNKVSKFLDTTDILIHNCGGIGSDPEEWELAMQKNYNIMVKLTNRWLRYFPKKGTVITIASIYGKESGGATPGFIAAKAAQIGWMKAMSKQYSNITFNCVSPGHIDVGKKFPDRPGMVGKPEDIAGLVVFLCSDQASYIDGVNIPVDGGESHSF